jgi:hypothetical protein
MPARRIVLTLATLLLVAGLAGCAPGPNPLAEQATTGQAAAGFWLGLWHGFIVWVTFVWSLFDPAVSVYEVHNAGWSYDLGFVIGAACLHGGGGAGACRRRRRD